MTVEVFDLIQFRPMEEAEGLHESGLHRFEVIGVRGGKPGSEKVLGRCSDVLALEPSEQGASHYVGKWAIADRAWMFHYDPKKGASLWLSSARVAVPLHSGGLLSTASFYPVASDAPDLIETDRPPWRSQDGPPLRRPAGAGVTAFDDHDCPVYGPPGDRPRPESTSHKLMFQGPNGEIADEFTVPKGSWTLKPRRGWAEFKARVCTCGAFERVGEKAKAKKYREILPSPPLRGRAR